LKIRSRPRSARDPRTPPGSATNGVAASVLGYASVPSDGSLEGPELESQRIEIGRACRSLGIHLVDLVPEREPARNDGRPGLERALQRLEAGEVSGLVVSGLERLSRRVNELASVIDRLERSGSRLIALDVGLDTASASGRLALERRPVAHPDRAPADDSVVEATIAEAAAAEAATAAEVAAAAEPAATEGATGGSPTVETAAETAAAGAPPAVEPPAAPESREATRALGYASLPADAERRADDLGAQSEDIERRCGELGIELVEIVRERATQGKALDRPGLSFLIERIAAGDASCVVVSGLDRLSHSVAELGTIVHWLERNEVRLVAVDLGLDTASPGGQTTARALASVANWEHERLSERTRKGLAAARAKRRAAADASAPGAPAPDWGEITKRIAAMRADGMTLQAIADALNAEGVPTQRGGAKWRPSSVQTAAGYKRRNRSKKAEDLPAVKRPSGRRGSGKPRK